METPSSDQRFTPLTHFNGLLKELNTVDYGLLSPYIYQLDSVPYKVISHQPKSEEDISQEVAKNLPDASIWLIDSIVNDPKLYLRQPPPEEVTSDWDNAQFLPYNHTEYGRHHTRQFFNEDWVLVFAKQPRFTPALDDLLSLPNDARQMRFRQFALLMDNLTNISKPFWNEIGKESKLLYKQNEEEREKWESFYKAIGRIDKDSTLPAEGVVDLEPLSWSLRKLSEFHRSLEISGINTINVPPTNGGKELYFGREFLGHFDRQIYKKVELISEFVERVRLVTGEIPISSLLDDKKTNSEYTHKGVALYFHYGQTTKELVTTKGGILKWYEEVGRNYGFSAKRFQQSCSQAKDFGNRTSSEWRGGLQRAIVMLKAYPRALALAKEELKSAEISNPVT